MRWYLDALLSVLLAPRCAACARLLDAPSRGPVCPACWASIVPITPPLCEGCGDPVASWRTISWQTRRCPRCRRRERAVDRGRAVGLYEGGLRRIVHAFKYDRRRTLGPRLAALMRDHGAALLGDAACAVPVPLHPRRRRARGFNQAADLAAHLGLPVAHALKRARCTPPQAGLPASRRHRNVRQAFAPARHWFGATPVAARLVRGQCVVLVDDVCTTGATLEACARVLKAMGAREVRALTVARVATPRSLRPLPPPPPSPDPRR